MTVQPNIPGHPDHFCCEDGVIARNRGAEQQFGATESAPSFIGTDGELYVVLPVNEFYTIGCRRFQVHRAFKYVDKVASAFQNRLRFRGAPGFLDGNRKNTALSNLYDTADENEDKQTLEAAEQPKAEVPNGASMPEDALVGAGAEEGGD